MTERDELDREIDRFQREYASAQRTVRIMIFAGMCAWFAVMIAIGWLAVTLFEYGPAAIGAELGRIVSAAREAIR